MRKVWTPQPKQAEFLSRPEYEVLYGGAAGGGKSDALIAEALRQVHIPQYKGLILRKTYPQLSELIDRSREIYKAAFPRARYNATEHTWTFPSGAKIIFGSMQHTSDRINYQGKRYDFVGFDELTHFSFDEYSYLFSRNRPNCPDTRCYIRATCNPGGIGHAWVKERFIAPAPPLTPIDTEQVIDTPDGGEITIKRSRLFVPSTVFDNKILLSNAPEYLASLSMLPEAERNALLYGDWDSFAGQVFGEWRNLPEHYRDMQGSHVITPFEVPDHWTVVRGFDFGYAKPFSVGWFAFDESGRMYHIAELYGCTSTPNTGIKVDPQTIARMIKDKEKNDPVLMDKTISGVADPSIFDKSRGESVADLMAREGVYWSPGDNARIAGKMQAHYRLKFDDRNRAMFYVFDTCKHFIRTIPALVYDEHKIEDVDTTQEDHIYDMWRYVCMQRRISPPKPVKKVRPAFDPLDLWEG